jgi:hypothetical protein
VVRKVANKRPTVQIEPDKWYALGDYDRQICCDCCLVHTLEYKLDKGRIFERVTVDEKATAAERQKHGIKVVRGPT